MLTMYKYCFFLLFWIGTLSAQKVKVKDLYQYAVLAESAQSFDYIPQDFSLPRSHYVGSLTGNCPKVGPELGKLYQSFWDTANLHGANGYRIEAVQKTDSGLKVEMSIWNLESWVFQRMHRLYPLNKVYLIGSLNEKGIWQATQINDKTVSLEPLHYIALNLPEQGELRINTGGVMGETIKLSGLEDALPFFYITNDYPSSREEDQFRVFPSIGRGGIGIGFEYRPDKKGFQRLDRNIGLFLLPFIEVQEN